MARYVDFFNSLSLNVFSAHRIGISPFARYKLVDNTNHSTG